MEAAQEVGEALGARAVARAWMLDQEELRAVAAALPLAAGAYIVYDLPKQNSYGGSGSQLRFFTWAPSAAPGKASVIYAAQRRALDAVFTGCIDSLAVCKADLEAVLGGAKADEEEWDPDA